MAAHEIEWQFEPTSPQKVRRWLASRGLVLARAKRHVDTYLDTSDHRLFRALRSLRIRKTSEGYEATLKSIAPAHEGLRDRLEITERIPHPGIEHLDAKGRIATEIRLIVGDKTVAPIVVIETFRSKVSTRVGRANVEVCLDRFSASILGRRAVCPVRLEIETSSANPAVAAFVQEMVDLGAEPTKGSKLEAAMTALALKPVGAPRKGDISSARTLGELAIAITRVQRRALWAQEPKALLGEDPEGVHNLRVALRRLRVGLGMLAPVLPPVEPLRNEAKRIASVLSACRDLDVLIEASATWDIDPAAQKVIHVHLLGERRRAKRALRRMIASEDYQRFLSNLESLRGTGPVAKVSVASAAADLVETAAGKVRKAAKRAVGGTPEDVHTLRKRLKRLRYTIEFVKFHAPTEAASFVLSLAELQDALGELQDLRVQGEWESRLAPLLADGTLDGIASARLDREAELRAAALKRVRSVLGKPLKALQRSLVEACLTAWRPVPPDPEFEDCD